MKINRKLKKFHGIDPFFLDFLDECLNNKTPDDEFPMHCCWCVESNTKKNKELTITEEDLLYDEQEIMTIEKLLNFISNAKSLDLNVMDKIDPVKYEAELDRLGGREHLRAEFNRLKNFLLGESHE